jgi:hypothetical protein
MNIHSAIGACLLWLACWACPVAAAELGQAGVVKISEGQVSILRGSTTLEAPVGTAVRVGDRVRTGPGGSAGITFNDDTRLSLGPGSTLLINDFSFDTTSHEGGMVASFLKGTFSVVTGLLAKHSPGAVIFKTPASTLGIRGTEFVVDVEGGAD